MIAKEGDTTICWGREYQWWHSFRRRSSAHSFAVRPSLLFLSFPHWFSTLPGLSPVIDRKDKRVLSGHPVEPPAVQKCYDIGRSKIHKSAFFNSPLKFPFELKSSLGNSFPLKRGVLLNWFLGTRIFPLFLSKWRRSTKMKAKIGNLWSEVRERLSLCQIKEIINDSLYVVFMLIT